MIVAGVMSGTSADGINVAFVSLKGRAFGTKIEVLAHSEYTFPSQVRREILAMMNANVAVADLTRMGFLLAELYADAVNAIAKDNDVKPELIGCHGQTIYHQGQPLSYLGRKIACTLQIGDGSTLAARCGVPVVSDFRPADMACGGNGAPLVPFLDYTLFRHRKRGRIVQNIGGIANLSAIPAQATSEQVLAFDTGPGNMVIDQVMDRLFGKRFDRDGRTGGRGTPIQNVLSDLLKAPFFRKRAPKTAGREEFGKEFVADLIKRCAKARPEDIVATATALTARSIGNSVRSLVQMTTNAGGHGQKSYHDYIVSGGGAKNCTLMRMLEEELSPMGLQIRISDDLGLPSDAKEAAAFALLAYETWQHRPSNVPSATGASRPAILGKISYA